MHARLSTPMVQPSLAHFIDLDRQFSLTRDDQPTDFGLLLMANPTSPTNEGGPQPTNHTSANPTTRRHDTPDSRHCCPKQSHRSVVQIRSKRLELVQSRVPILAESRLVDICAGCPPSCRASLVSLHIRRISSYQQTKGAVGIISNDEFVQALESGS
jgi:hypothetical protein